MAVTALVCLDKDGTLIENVPHNVDPARIRLVPGALSALAALQRGGYRLVVVSNQPGVAQGRFPLRAREPVAERLGELCAAGGVELAGFYACPHDPEGSGELAVACDCRKPAPGLVQRALREHGADAASSWMVGDILDDVEAGRRAGCRTVLVDVGNETEWVDGPMRRPDITVRSLHAAAEAILAASASTPLSKAAS